MVDKIEMLHTYDSGHVGLGRQEEQIVDGVNDVLRLHILLSLVCATSRYGSVHADVRDALHHGSCLFIAIGQIVLEHVITAK